MRILDLPDGGCQVTMTLEQRCTIAHLLNMLAAHVADGDKPDRDMALADVPENAELLRRAIDLHVDYVDGFDLRNTASVAWALAEMLNGDDAPDPAIRLTQLQTERIKTRFAQGAARRVEAPAEHVHSVGAA